MKIYFAGSIRGGRDNVYDYQKFINQFEKNSCDVLTKHVGDPNLTVEGEDMEPAEIYKRDCDWIKECDILFADINLPSLGVGYEISYAETLGKKVYAIYKKNSNVSGYLRGDPNLNILAYENNEEVLEYIDKICGQ